MVLEVPILTYSDLKFGRRRHLKNLTVTGSGTGESRSVLQRACDAGLEDIVILTHPFEFVKRRNGGYDTITPNRVNQTRLIRLCQEIIASGDYLQARTFSDKAGEWLAGGDLPAVPVAASAPASCFRMLENGLNDTIWSYPTFRR